MSSLKPEHAVSDWSDLDEKDTKTLHQWYDYFQKVRSLLNCYCARLFTDRSCGSAITLSAKSSCNLLIDPYNTILPAFQVF